MLYTGNGVTPFYILYTRVIHCILRDAPRLICIHFQKETLRSLPHCTVYGTLAPAATSSQPPRPGPTHATHPGRPAPPLCTTSTHAHARSTHAATAGGGGHVARGDLTQTLTVVISPRPRIQRLLASRSTAPSTPTRRGDAALRDDAALWRPGRVEGRCCGCSGQGEGEGDWEEGEVGGWRVGVRKGRWCAGGGGEGEGACGRGCGLGVGVLLQPGVDEALTHTYPYPYH